MPEIFLAVPSYDGMKSLDNERAVLNTDKYHPSGYTVVYVTGGSSLLTGAFNGLWCQALNLRQEHDIRWFVMLHNDIGLIEQDWLNTLIETAEEYKLDALAAHALIKDTSHDTSTAIWKDGQPKRVTLEQSSEWNDVVTSDALGDILCINTGCLAIRFNAGWVEKYWPKDMDEPVYPPMWSMQDGIYKNDDGQYQASCLSEDWRMSLWFHEQGIPYGVTHRIHTVHSGCAKWVFPK